jgi:hypothetical protein
LMLQKKPVAHGRHCPVNCAAEALFRGPDLVHTLGPFTTRKIGV